MNWTWFLFGFKGRINRAKLWLAVQFILCLMLFLMFVLAMPVGYFFGFPARLSFNIDNLFVIFNPSALRGMSRPDITVVAINCLFMPLFLWILLATSVKRLHDRDRNGWWLVPFFVIPSLWERLSDWLPDSYWFLPLTLISMILFLWGFIELYFLRGAKGTNQYGPDPLGEEPARTRSEQTRLRATTPGDRQSEIEIVPHKASAPPV